LITGVYSNGDLFANYVGMKFYQGLTREIKSPTETRPAILVLKQGLWAFNEYLNLREVLLKPLISDHFNEALNPSIFSDRLGLRWFVRQKVSKRSCARWFNRYPKEVTTVLALNEHGMAGGLDKTVQRSQRLGIGPALCAAE
jgi:hypothetical protein